MIKLLLNKIYASIFGYSFRRNVARRFLNSLLPNFIKSFLAKYYWSKVNFENSETKTIVVYDTEEAYDPVSFTKA